MRRLAAILILAACVILGIIACSDDDSTNNEPALGSITATIEGQSFKSSTAVGSDFSSSIQIMGSQDGSIGKTITIVILGPKIGSNDSSTTISYTVNPNNGGAISVWRADAPKIYISKLTDKEVSGTFSFTGAEPTNPASKKEVTEGKFRVKLTKITL